MRVTIIALDALAYNWVKSHHRNLRQKFWLQNRSRSTCAQLSVSDLSRSGIINLRSFSLELNCARGK